ncbi:hypothetical protein MUK42_12663 [Musa troglodytarum]|uniref:Uncharacterized protein n=1 Tax=Musa troglodytarum TaxID=320322 RepID=A0A9E7GSJ7_9LILI|nr:hypothetical protein MUK42_12663 [Musa troglodytarum]
MNQREALRRQQTTEKQRVVPSREEEGSADELGVRQQEDVVAIGRCDRKRQEEAAAGRTSP